MVDCLLLVSNFKTCRIHAQVEGRSYIQSTETSSSSQQKFTHGSFHQSQEGERPYSFIINLMCKWHKIYHKAKAAELFLHSWSWWGVDEDRKSDAILLKPLGFSWRFHLCVFLISPDSNWILGPQSAWGKPKELLLKSSNSFGISEKRALHRAWCLCRFSSQLCHK